MKPKPKESSRDQPLGVNKTSPKKRADLRYTPYTTKRNEPKSKAKEDSAF